MHGMACTRHSGQHALIAVCLCSQSECRTDCSAGNCLSARKKQRGPGKEGLAQDNPNPIRTTAEQHLFWLPREQYKTAAGPPDYTAMMAHFNITWLKQTKLVLLQVKAPALLCISAMQQQASRHIACMVIPMQISLMILHAFMDAPCHQSTSLLSAQQSVFFDRQAHLVISSPAHTARKQITSKSASAGCT